MSFTRRDFLKLAIVSGGATALPAGAQPAPFPSKPLQIIVPFATGGGNDVMARMVAPALSRQLGQPVIVDNKVGAGGNIGSQFVARAPADGHTLLLATNTLTLNPFLLKSIPFDVTTDLAPVGTIANQPIVVVTHPSVPAKNMRELIAYLKREPGKLFYASPGNGTPHHFAAEMFKLVAGVSMNHVPYKGAVPALTDLIAGQVQVMFASVISALPFIRDGRITALATAEGRRIAILPDLPTVKEAALPTYEATIWGGLMTTGGTPTAIVNRLSEAMLAAVKQPELTSQLNTAGFAIDAGSPEDMRNLIRNDLQQWGKVAAAVGIVPE